MAAEPLGGGATPPESDAALAAARGVLATLTAGRAALLQLAAAHLPFDRVLALHRAASDDAGWLDDAGGMIERRLAVQGRAGLSGGLSGGLSAERLAPVPRAASLAPAPLPSRPVPVRAAPPPAPAEPVRAPVAATPPVEPVRAPVAEPVRAAPTPPPVEPVRAAPTPPPVEPVRAAPTPPPAEPIRAPVAAPAPAAAASTSRPATPTERPAARFPSGPERMVRSLLQERTPAPRYPSAGPTYPPAELDATVSPFMEQPAPPAKLAAATPAPVTPAAPPAAATPAAPAKPPVAASPAPPPVKPPVAATPAAPPVVAAPAPAPAKSPAATAAPPVIPAKQPAPPPAKQPVAAAPPAPTPAPKPPVLPATPAIQLAADSGYDLGASAPAEPTAYRLGAAEPTGDFPLTDEPSELTGSNLVELTGSELLPADEEPLEASDVEPALQIIDEHSFSDAGENTANWSPNKRAVTIEDLLGNPPAEADATLISAAPLSPGGEDLFDWAANALGFPDDPDSAPKATRKRPPEPAAPPRSALPRPAPRLARDEEDDEPVPMLREPRAGKGTGAAIDVRAAAQGAPPRSRVETIEVAEPTGDFPEPASDDDAFGASAGFQVTFERGSPARPAPRAPRLTEEEGDETNPGALGLPAMKPVVADDKQVQALLDDAQGHARRGDLAKAIQAFTDALDMRPTLVEAHIGRGRCYLELGDYSSAMSDFARAEDLAPDRPDAHVATGDLYFARKEYKRAIEFYDQAVELDGSHAMARCRRGISHYYRKNYRQAYQDLQRALALDPEIPNMRKYVQMAQKKLERGE